MSLNRVRRQRTPFEKNLQRGSENRPADPSLARFTHREEEMIMRSFNSLLALGLVVAPLVAAPHGYGQEIRPSAELLGASGIHSQSADLLPMELAQATSTTPNPSPSCLLYT